MKVSDCMSADVRIASPGQTLREAARLMLDIDAGALPVGDNDRLVGMITDRDIAVRGVAVGKGPEDTVGEVMTREVRYCFDDEEIVDVARQMAQLKVRRMPVVSRDKRLVGIVSLGDVSQTDEDDSPSGAALSRISEPGGQHTQQ